MDGTEGNTRRRAPAGHGGVTDNRPTAAVNRGSSRAPVAAAVHTCRRGGHVELRFDPGFTPADVATVRAVPGREWHHEQLIWVLPDTPATQHALERSFGQRLVRSDQPATADQAHPPARDAVLQRLREAASNTFNLEQGLQVTIWQPGEWEEWINSLLRARYPLGDFQQVPHEHGGDYGIEGFSTDGCAYQCYCPAEPLSVKGRYEAHRDKISADIAKFMANASRLERVFGPTVIRRWLLVVPRHDSGPLLIHAEHKAVLVRRSGLSYVNAADFRIGVVTADYFAQERAMLGAAAAVRIHIPPPSVTATERDLIEAGGSAFLDNLDAKSARLPTLSKDTDRQQFRQAIMTYYVQGQVVLDRLRRDYPQVFEIIVQEKAARARQLEMESLLATGNSGDRVTREIQAMQHTIELRFPNISSETRTSLAMEALSGWLLTCPLDFREVA